MNVWRAACPWGLWMALSACAGAPDAYTAAIERSRTAERAGNYPEAARALEEAAERAPSSRDRDEMLYRKAFLHRKMEEPAQAGAALEAYARKFPRSERAPRALLDAGRAYERANRAQAARRAYDEIIERYPRSGGALTAAERWVALSAAPAPDAWRALLERVSDPELEEGARYRLARSLEESDPAREIQEYEALVRRFPLPRGVYADEALYRAALLRRALGDPEGALITLEILLEARSSSFFFGSYERSSFAAARLLEGEILRDDLRRPEEALVRFERLFSEHPTSRLRDDALFQKAWTLFFMGRGDDACATLTRLEDELPDSSFARCGALFCEPQRAELSASCCARAPTGPRPPRCE